MTYQILLFILGASVTLYLCKHLFQAILKYRRNMQRAQMKDWLDWDNTNRATRRRREDAKLTRWQKYGITN